MADARVATPAVSKDGGKKILPTDRIKCFKQLAILRAYAVAHGKDGAPVGPADVAALVDMEPSTVTLTSAFFVDSGLLSKKGTLFIPSPEVVAFNRAFEWDKDRAAFKLVPILSKTWFVQAILPQLQFKGNVPEQEAIALLGDAAEAGTDRRTQLRMLLEFGWSAGLWTLNDGQVTYVRPETDEGPPGNDGPKPASGEETTKKNVEKNGLTNALFPEDAASGAVQFHFSIKVEMSEIGSWDPGRISAFFSGIAQVLAARGKTDDGSSK